MNRTVSRTPFLTLIPIFIDILQSNFCSCSWGSELYIGTMCIGTSLPREISTTCVYIYRNETGSDPVCLRACFVSEPCVFVSFRYKLILGAHHSLYRNHVHRNLTAARDLCDAYIYWNETGSDPVRPPSFFVSEPYAFRFVPIQMSVVTRIFIFNRFFSRKSLKNRRKQGVKAILRALPRVVSVDC